MKKYIKEIVILLIQLIMFYLSPLFAGSRDALDMVLLIIIFTLLLSIVIGSISSNKIKYLWSIVVAVVFIPSVFIYYNDSALIHSVWYFAVSFIGLFAGVVIHKLTYKQTTE